MPRFLKFLWAASLLLVACATPEILAPRSGAVPPGIDLSGNYRMRETSRADRFRLREAIDKTDGVDSRSRTRRQSPRMRGSGDVRGGLVHVFLETGTALKVTQTDYALFISFDRSVVEEFRFGENRLVSVGQVEAQRVTGWEDGELVVETLGENGMKLTERISLVENGTALRRRITFRSRKLEEESLVQVFDRTG